MGGASVYDEGDRWARECSPVRQGCIPTGRPAERSAAAVGARSEARCNEPLDYWNPRPIHRPPTKPDANQEAPVPPRHRRPREQPHRRPTKARRRPLVSASSRGRHGEARRDQEAPFHRRHRPPSEHPHRRPTKARRRPLVSAIELFELRSPLGEDVAALDAELGGQHVVRLREILGNERERANSLVPFPVDRNFDFLPSLIFARTRSSMTSCSGVLSPRPWPLAQSRRFSQIGDHHRHVERLVVAVDHRVGHEGGN